MNKFSKKKIIYVAPGSSGFIKHDLDLLKQFFNVNANCLYKWKQRKVLTPLFLIHQLFWLIFNIKDVEIIIVSFGGYWSYMPTLLGKIFKIPVFIILNGTDCASIPPVNFGSLRKSIQRWFCKKSYQNASILLPVSSSLIKIKNTYFSDDKYSYQGYKNILPEVKTPAVVFHNGVDGAFWKMDNNTIKLSNSFLAVFGQSQFLLKGGDLIIKLAQIYPRYQFYIAGCTKPNTISNSNRNIIFLGKITPEVLRYYYRKCQFYFQLSVFEGFGVSLCEAMLCECVPIVSSVNILPEIVGETGFVIHKRDIMILKRIIQDVVNREDLDFLGTEARNRILEKYSLEKRQMQILEIINKS